MVWLPETQRATGRVAILVRFDQCSSPHAERDAHKYRPPAASGREDQARLRALHPRAALLRRCPLFFEAGDRGEKQTL